MAGYEQTIQETLNRCALIFRKYNLGYRDVFFQQFSEFRRVRLEASWVFAAKEIQNREIIKDTSAALNAEDRSTINSLVVKFGTDKEAIYDYLLSKFDVHALKLHEENVERRIRQILAKKYLTLVSLSKKDLIGLKDVALADRFSFILKRHKIAAGIISALLFIGAFSTPRIIDGLTPPDLLLNKYLEAKYGKIEARPINEDVLTNYLHEESVYKGNGAICRDDWVSHSTGRGTCSHHGGVRYWYFKGQYSRTIEECRKEAVKTIDELSARAAERSWKD